MDRIPHVNQAVHQRRLVWAFWIACGLAAIGGIAPFVFAGTSGREGGVLIPFWIAAVALGACAMFYRQGRPLVTGLYFIAGLAIVYGMLLMLSVPLRLLVVGTCPPSPAHCLTGLERPLTEGETTGLWFAIGIGALAVFVGFFGLFAAYRRPLSMPSTPAVRSIPPVEDHPAASTPVETLAAPGPAATAEVVTEPKPESPATDSEAESNGSTQASSASEEVAPAAPAPKPRQRRVRKPVDDTTPRSIDNE